MRFEEASYQAMLCADKNGYTGREIKIYELDDEWIPLWEQVAWDRQDTIHSSDLR